MYAATDIPVVEAIQEAKKSDLTTEPEAVPVEVSCPVAATSTSITLVGNLLPY
jgi:hypothetical protein